MPRQSGFDVYPSPTLPCKRGGSKRWGQPDRMPTPTLPGEGGVGIISTSYVSHQLMNNMKRLAIPLLIITALAALAIWGALQQSRPQTAQALVCPDPSAGCAFLHRGQPAHLQFSAQPEALKPFVLSLTSPGLHKASVSFRMAGMDMGFNRYHLRPETGGRQIADITLPVCTASRADWIAELDLDGRLYRLSFTTR